MKKNILLGLMPFVAAVTGAFEGNRIRYREATGGHRAPGYVITPADVDRLEAAAERRKRRAAIRHERHQRCLANNPCLQSYP